MESKIKIVRKVQHEIQSTQNKLSTPLTIDLKNDPYYFYIRIEDGGHLAVQANAIGMKKESDCPLNKKQLDRMVNLIRHKVSYLPENLHLIEQDSTNLKTLLRSEYPQIIDDSIEYFELSINPDPDINLYRILNKNRLNTKIPFVISYDLLERFFVDCQDIMDTF